MKSDDNLHDGPELRSKKVRQLLGDTPPAILRWGTVIIFVIFLIVAVIVCCMPFPYSDGETVLQHLLS